MQSTSKSKLNYHYRLDKMQSIMKTRHDNYMIDRTSVISIEYDIELSRPIELCTIYDENKIGQ